MARLYLPFILLLTHAFGLANSDVEKDKEECANTLVGLATCLPYVGGDAKAPTLDCCNGLKDVLKKNRKCLCVLIRDRNDPSLGLKINSTLALGLPATCHAPVNISDCTSLLHLSPNSPDAKVFEDYEKNNQGNTTTASPTKGNSSATTGSSAKITNEGGRTKGWIGVEMVSFIIASVMVHLFISNFI